ncbi:undecaprenyl/decaprenyl-phosphate alpha-N-acetylglucosaminyl 1-phosphate transferase [Vagococcus coleopterorum]|uniref:Undecaprenyl/decaprenyl-phosphate alpha-N-acetylglucosaminyl 1-phosphate transferase n=1 Tax=Vagococcus coleopterorum TaxID=2714946 RepID=A0A6G8AKR3_9ENTE|nr:MraY family glycosyltransferase [Vagococcus coleopterorum]QIL45648.1 undecaprenyl/decaprenyl-phosphate alpha-N-acetylglucosaminyl 1-phosphate transferase [Vagococcus coleopterorum]
MNEFLSVSIRLVLTGLLAFALTPLIKKLAFKINAVDQPNERRINKLPMPSAGGLAIFLTFVIATLFIFPDVIPFDFAWRLIVSSLAVVATGLLDDIFELSPRQKLVGITIGALLAFFVLGARIDIINLFSSTEIDFGFLSLPLTLLWIIALTNAINLIDGLDGLATGVSMIALAAIGIVGYIAAASGAVASQLPITIFVLIFCSAGFLPYNFNPAKIYLGDTGALFLGFMIAVLSLQGLKNATLVSLITPLIILGVPITDTVFAIIRRLLNKQPISTADQMHLHHRLLSLGFTHRGAVLMIYGLAILFSCIAIMYSFASTLANIFLIIALLFAVELFVELIGLSGSNRQPLINALKYVGNKAYRDKRVAEKKIEKIKNKVKKES